MINCTSNISENEECKVHRPIKQSELQKEVNRVHRATRPCKQDRTGQGGTGPLDTNVHETLQHNKGFWDVTTAASSKSADWCVDHKYLNRGETFGDVILKHSFV